MQVYITALPDRMKTNAKQKKIHLEHSNTIFRGIKNGRQQNSTRN